MTTTIKLVSIPMAVVILAAAFLVVLPRDLPTITLPAAAPAADESWEKLGLYDMAAHTDPEHDPYRSGSDAQYIVEDVQIGWPGGPDDDWKCFTIRLAGKIMREVFWHRVAPGASYGDLAWFDYQVGLTGKWGGAYPYKVQETVGNLPKDLRGKGYTIESGCGRPPPFTPAH